MAETSKKHFEGQVEQLNRQLHGNEEKLAVYERRSIGAAAGPASADDGLSRDQQLEAEIAELRQVYFSIYLEATLRPPSSSALKVAEVDLATARSHVQQFKDISQANETALATLTSTYEEYKMTTDAQLTSREVRVVDFLLPSRTHCLYRRTTKLSRPNW